MSRLNPEKLSVEFREGVTTTEPIIPRHYTLTHSDLTAELFLTIGLKYAYDKTNAMRDEVLGKWVKYKDRYFYYVYLYVDGEFSPKVTAIRNYIFRRELPLALEAIRYGDKEFFTAHPELNDAPIIVYFMSTNPQFNRIENWGTFSDYDINRFYWVPQGNSFNQNTYLLDNAYDLLAFQRIIGTSNSDTLGLIQSLISWDGQKFVSSKMFAAILGTNLISPYQP